ncbi:MAG: hypothetical protein ACKOCT_05910, partial [Alphaproteobacteria bacterium]
MKALVPLGRPVSRRARRGLVGRSLGSLVGERGATLVELLVAAALSLVVCLAALALLGLHASIARALQGELAAGSASAWALEVALRDVQLAGNDPAGAGIGALRAGTPESIELDADLDGDGSVDASSAERRALSWGASSGGRVLRRLGAQSVGIASPVAAGGFALRYRAADGSEVASGRSLSSAELGRVKRVDVEVAVRTGVADRPEVRLRSSAAI